MGGGGGGVVKKSQINYTQIEASVTLHILLNSITISWKRYVFYRSGSVHVILFKLDYWKKIAF